MPVVRAADPAPRVAQAAPQIDRFSAEPVSDLSPGTELVFTLEGTPGSKASVTIAGIASNLTMREAQPGVYEARYTIRCQDRIGSSTAIRANLQRGNRTVSAGLDQPLSASNPEGGEATGLTRIERFTVDPIDRIEPGAELIFRLSGTPRARATFTIGGVVRDRPMEEASPGEYESRYTVKRSDNFPPGVAITASLKGGRGPVATARLDQGLINDTEPPTVTNLTPPDGTDATSNRPLVSGLFEDGRGSGTDLRSVRIRFNGRDVTSESTSTANFFNYQPPRRLPPGEYRVEVSLKDLSGNPAQAEWSFRVPREASAATQQLTLEVQSPANNSQVPAGPVTVRGRTAPRTSVAIEVRATTSLVGFFGVTQNILSRTVTADAQGNFSFQFQSRFTAPGTRYEADLTATRDGETRQQRLVLIQQ